MTRLDMGVPVTFECEGARLVGSLHTPHGRAADLGVILLNQGPIDRTGSHRLYIKLAARLTSLGIPVLRFDARGVGESEGRWASAAISVPKRTATFSGAHGFRTRLRPWSSCVVRRTSIA